MEKVLDVSMLEPCQPLEQSLERVRRLEAGDYLRVIHRRDPKLLYPLLEQMGYLWHTLRPENDRYEILIWRGGDKAAESDVASRLEEAC